MKFLVIGLGSMGKRRIRCLKALGFEQISGYDSREDRRQEVSRDYAIDIYADFRQAFELFDPDALIISVPPDQHHKYIDFAIENARHCFIEGSVVDTGMERFIEALKSSGIVAAPSATLLFHPAIEMIKNIVKTGELGTISNILFHSGQYLPDWHTYEKVSEYYVSNPATGGGREIVPFELSWITNIFGFPQRLCGNFKKTIHIEGADIDDTYNALLDFGGFMAVLTVDVVSRCATRKLVINGSERQLTWDWNYNLVKLYDPRTETWEERPYQMDSAASGYNANIGENMYIEEIRNFADAMQGKRAFINSMENDWRILKLLYAIEESDRTSAYVSIKS